MQHSYAQITRQLMINLGVGSDIGTDGKPLGDWPIYDSNEPPNPDNCITVYDTQGLNQGRTNIDGEPQGPDGIMFRIGAKSKLIGWAKASDLRATISSRTGGTYRVRVTLDTETYEVHCYSRIGKVIPLGKESPTSTRRLFTINCVVSISQCH